MRQTSFAQPREVTAETGDSPESEWFDRFAPDMRDGLVHRVGRIDKAEIGRANHFVTGHLIDETDQFLPIIGSHNHDRKILDFPRLNQSHRFEQLIQRAGAAGHDDECV